MFAVITLIVVSPIDTHSPLVSAADYVLLVLDKFQFQSQFL